MIRLRAHSIPLAAALAVGLALTGLAGCAKKLPLDPREWGLVAYPEGRRDSLERTPSDLVVWPDLPVTVREVWSDTTAGPDRTFLFHRSGPGAMQGAIFDYTQADGYQVYREEAGGGYRQFTDFSLVPRKRWTDRMHYGAQQAPLVLAPAQLFGFTDLVPAALAQRSYVGRAVISGLSSANHPLTNRGVSPDTSAIPTLRYTGPVKDEPLGQRLDSLLIMSWETIPGAAGYWVHIFQKRADIQISEEAIAIGLPSPIAMGKVRDLFIGYFPSSITAYKLGDPLPTGVRVLVYRVLLGNQEVLIRVSAVDAAGRLIATTGTAGDSEDFAEKFGQIERRRNYGLGATKVTPGRILP